MVGRLCLARVYLIRRNAIVENSSPRFANRLRSREKSRNADEAKRSLDEIRKTARDDVNVMPALIEASLHKCTLGEMVQAMAHGLDKAIVDGDTTNPHQDSDVDTSTNVRRAWIGTPVG